MGNTKLKLIHMEDIAVEEVEWLLYPLIPYGKITILQGDPGEGKTTAVLRIISSLTKGEPLPFESEKKAFVPVNVIYQTAEDGLGDTIKPRLLAADADCSHVLVIDDTEKALTITDERLEEAVVQTEARLVVLDPIQGYLGAEVDMHRANEIRPLMSRLAKMAEKHKCAILLIGHMNKNAMGKCAYRGLGSIDITAAARSVLLCGRVKDEPEIRVICQVKSSLAPEATPIAFRLDKETGFSWIGEYEISPEELLTGDNRGSKLREAQNFLMDFLKDGEKKSKEAEAAAREKGIRTKTLYNAKAALNIDSVKIGREWYWLPK